MGGLAGGAAAAQGLARHQSAGGEQLCCASLAYFYYYYYCFPFLLILINCLYLNPQVYLFFLILCPIPLGGREQSAVWFLAACQVKPQQTQEKFSLKFSCVWPLAQAVIFHLYFLNLGKFHLLFICMTDLRGKH